MEVSHRDAAYDWIGEAVAIWIGVMILIWLLSSGGLSSSDLLIIGVAWLLACGVIAVSLFEKVDSLILQRLAIHAKASEGGRE